MASRIGAVRGDLIGIEILERGGNRAIDELTVEVPSSDLLELLVREVHEVDGVDVEDVREWHQGEHDTRIAPLEVVLRLIDESDVEGVAKALVSRLAEMFELSFAAVVSTQDEMVVVGEGAVPPERWLLAFVKGGSLRSQLEGVTEGNREIMLHGLDFNGWTLVAARDARAFRALERSQIWMLTQIAGRCATQLAKQSQRPELG